MEEKTKLQVQDEINCDENGVVETINTDKTENEQEITEMGVQENVPTEIVENDGSGQETETIIESAPMEEKPSALNLLQSEYEALAAAFPEELPFTHLADMPRLGAFLTLREKGLSPKEAYLAIEGVRARGAQGVAHLRAAAPRVAVSTAPALLSHETLAEWRRLFPHLSDREIGELYRRTAPNQ